jgi:hypothetical protein
MKALGQVEVPLCSAETVAKFNPPAASWTLYGGVVRRELYPDSSLQTDTILVSGEHVITEWTLKTTITEPFYGGLSRKVPVSLHGASIVRIDNGKIIDWSDYYDGLTSRRTALASYFTEWVGL